MTQPPDTAADNPLSANISRQVRERCIQCGLCGAHCAFLSGREFPGRLAQAHETDPESVLDLAFNCSLCGFCTSVCPKHLDLPALFLSWRQEAVSTGKRDLAPYHGILAYEIKGCSPLFSHYHLPRGCDTVFFPGCTLTGTRPAQTLKAYAYLQNRIPGAGMVLDCCTKPSHDLGRHDFFRALFAEMCRYLKGHGITTVITACPSCHILFSSKSPFRTLSIYELMANDEALTNGTDFFIEDSVSNGFSDVMIQDPCQARNDKATQKAVRNLARKMGLIPAKGQNAVGPIICCGEGASVGCVSPGLAATWTLKRQKAARGKTSITYCAGCTSRLSANGQQTLHLLDLIFDPVQTRGKGPRVSRAPLTYLNRLRVKQQLRSLPSAICRERPASNEPPWAATCLRGARALVRVAGAALAAFLNPR